MLENNENTRTHLPFASTLTPKVCIATSNFTWHFKNAKNKMVCFVFKQVMCSLLLC